MKSKQCIQMLFISKIKGNLETHIYIEQYGCLNKHKAEAMNFHLVENYLGHDNGDMEQDSVVKTKTRTIFVSSYSVRVNFLPCVHIVQIFQLLL